MIVKQEKSIFFYKVLFLFIISNLSLGAQNLNIKFDGEAWWQDFKNTHQAKLFNSHYSLKSNHPHLLWKNIGEGGCLLFDGYSTYMEVENFKFSKQFNVSFWIAPRAFDNAIDNKLASIIDYSSRNDSLSFKVGLLKHGQLVVQYGEGKKEIRFTNDQLFLIKNEWSFVNVIQDLKSIRIQINGKELLNMPLDNEIVEEQFKASNYILTIGRNSNASGFGEKFKFNMISGLLDEIIIQPLNNADNNKINFDSHPLEDLTQVLRLDYTKFNEDFRPNYHAIAPAHWMNEPHAPLYFNGKYHLFYQHNPFGPYWGQIHWGHWVSDDMVHWKHVDIALSPEKGSLDPDGIWSGSAFVGPDNTPMLFYTAANESKAQNQYTAIAFPKDKNDKNLVFWEKSGIVVNKPSEYLPNEFRDPFVFKIDSTYYMIVGSGIKNQGGTAVLFESNDAKSWKYLHPFYQTDIQKYPFMGGVWELPVFLPLPTKEGKNTGKYVFMVLPSRDAANVEVFYWIGTFDKKTKKFKPDQEKPVLLDYGDFGFTGQSGLVDPKTNRSIVFSIAQGQFGKLDTYEMGWAHNAGLPINLWLSKNNSLQFSPINELKLLREKALISCENCDVSLLKTQLNKVVGDQLEIDLNFDVDEIKKGIVFRKSDDGVCQAMLYFDPVSKSIVFDKTQDESGENVVPIKVPFSNQKNANVRIFLDKSMVEIYVNNEFSITERIYFSKEALNIKLIGFENKSKIKRFQIWPMKSINWEYVEPFK